MTTQKHINLYIQLKKYKKRLSDVQLTRREKPNQLVAAMASNATPGTVPTLHNDTAYYNAGILDILCNNPKIFAVMLILHTWEVLCSQSCFTQLVDKKN